MSVAEIATLITSISALFGVIIVVRKVFWESKHQEARATDQFQKILSQNIKDYKEELALNKQYRRKIDQLEGELEEVIAIVEAWDMGIKALIQQLEDNRLTPAWRPKKHYERKSIEV